MQFLKHSVGYSCHKARVVDITKARFPLPELTGRVDDPSTRLVETRTRQHGPCCWRVMETGHPSTRAVNSGSGNRA